MAKLIVEMNMPIPCIWTDDDGKTHRCQILMADVYCKLQGDKASEASETCGTLRKGCTIVGVLPDEHGRLVDADACSSVLRKLENKAKTNTEKLCYGYAAKMFEEAFTIVAAERKADEH